MSVGTRVSVGTGVSVGRGVKVGDGVWEGIGVGKRVDVGIIVAGTVSDIVSDVGLVVGTMFVGVTKSLLSGSSPSSPPDSGSLSLEELSTNEDGGVTRTGGGGCVEVAVAVGGIGVGVGGNGVEVGSIVKVGVADGIGVGGGVEVGNIVKVGVADGIGVGGGVDVGIGVKVGVADGVDVGGSGMSVGVGKIGINVGDT